jgi:hypothetical protein
MKGNSCMRSLVSILLVGCTILSGHVVWSQTTTTPVATTPVSRPTTTADSKTQLGGILSTRYNVDEYARLSLDIKEIRNRMDSNTNNDGSATSALEIYVDGLNANDATTGLKKSLQKLALNLAVKEPKTPPFLYQLYGLTGASSTHLNVDIESQAKYVDAFIRQVFETQPEFASDAILATDVWMVAADFIYNAIYNCAATTAADDPDAVQLSPGGFDEFIALYIGVDQSMGSADGHSLYALAQFMDDQFEVYADNEERVPEAVINTRIVLLYQEAANALSTPGACTKDATPDLASHLYNLGHQMVMEMVKLLFQGLIFSLAQQEMGGIRVYSKALIPQLSQCRPSLYKKLSKELLQLFDNDPDVESLDIERVEVILDALRDAMPCFGFYCEELGNVAGIAGFDLGCDKENRPFPMFAGYRASSDVSVVRIFYRCLHMCVLKPLLRPSPYTHAPLLSLVLLLKLLLGISSGFGCASIGNFNTAPIQFLCPISIHVRSQCSQGTGRRFTTRVCVAARYCIEQGAFQCRAFV